MNGIEKPPRALEYVVVGVTVLAFALSYGFNYGFDNQLVYFVKSLALVNPGILHADWFTNHTTQYHYAFIYLGALLLKLNAHGWAVALTQTLCVILGGLCLYRTVKRVAGPALAVPAFLMLVPLLFITHTSSVGTSYLFDTILQPSTLGALGSVAATWLFVEERWLASGIALAFGGLFHANYLVLAYPIFGLAHLALGFEDFKRRVVRQFGPLVAVTVVLSPFLLAASHHSPSADALDILFHIRSPHHYNPARYERNFIPFAAWQLLGIGGGWLLHRTPNGKRLGAVLTGLMLTIWAGTLLTTFIEVPKVNQIFVWRLAPNADICAQILLVCGLAQLLSRPRAARSYPPVAIALVGAGLGLIGLYYHSKDSAPLPRILLAYFGLAVAMSLLQLGFDLLERLRPSLESAVSEARRTLAYIPWLVGAIAMYQQAPSRVEGGYLHSTLLRDVSGHASEQLYRWLRESSPRDAVYLTPPDLEGARFLGQRAIVVDWKAVPLMPDELLVWYDRLCDVTGRHVRSSGDLGGYRSLDLRRLRRLEKKYHPDFVVVRRGDERRLPGLPLAYQNSSYSVLKLEPEPPAPTPTPQPEPSTAASGAAGAPESK